MNLGLGTCAACEGTAGVRGLGAIVMEPLKGGLGAGESGALASMINGAGVLAPGALMLGSGIYGGALGGLSAGSWRGSGTGALLAAGLTGIGAGLAVTGFSAMTPEGAVEMDSGAKIAGIAYAVVGAGMLAWGGYRAYKAIKGRR